MSSNISSLDQAQAVYLAPAILRPIPIPISVQAQAPTKAPSKELIEKLSNLIAEKGRVAGAHYAAQYHKSLNQANPPTADDLLRRLDDAQANLGEERYAKHSQNTPNAVALRFLAANAGQGYPFEQEET